MYFPGSPVVIVESSFAEGVLLETVLLSIYNHDSAIASAASRMTAMAGDRPCIEMGSRRTQELAAVAAARAAYIAGFRRHLQSRGRAPLRGADHRNGRARLHPAARDERQAFSAQIAALGPDTTLLVDTYDVFEAVKTRGGTDRRPARRGPARLR